MNSRNPASRFIYVNGPRRTYVKGAYGGRSHRTVMDRVGNKIPIYRELHVHRGKYPSAFRGNPKQWKIIKVLRAA